MARDATAKETTEIARWLVTSWSNHALTDYAGAPATARDRTAAPYTQHMWDAGESEGKITLFFNLRKLRAALDREAAKECKRRGFSPGGLPTSKRGGPKGSPVLVALVGAIHERIGKGAKIATVRDEKWIAHPWDAGQIVNLHITPKPGPKGGPFDVSAVVRWAETPAECSGTIRIGEAGLAPVRRYTSDPAAWARAAVSEVEGQLLAHAGVESQMDRLQRERQAQYPWINVRRFTTGALAGMVYESFEDSADTVGREVHGALGGSDYVIVEVKPNPGYRKRKRSK